MLFRFAACCYCIIFVVKTIDINFYVLNYLRGVAVDDEMDADCSIASFLFRLVKSFHVIVFPLLLLLGLALVALFTLHWKRRRYSRAPVELELDISDYRVLVLDGETQCEAYFKMKASQDHKFVGFDCEWVSNGGQKRAVPNEVSNSLPLSFQSCPSYYPVALLQLAFPDKQCALIRLSKIGKLTDSLTEILTNKR